MTEKKKTQKLESKIKQEKTENSKCSDKLCPFHGEKPLKLRGRVFQGVVIKKFHSRLTIKFERMFYIAKFERYEKRNTKLHARLPECLNGIEEGDYIQIEETRPTSKIIHFVATKLIKKGNKK